MLSYIAHNAIIELTRVPDGFVIREPPSVSSTSMQSSLYYAMSEYGVHAQRFCPLSGQKEGLRSLNENKASSMTIA